MAEIKIEYIGVDELTPADYNPRVDLQEGDKEFDKLKKSIDQFGFVEPLVYNERTKRLVGGHQRLKVAKVLGYDTVPIVRIDVPEEQEKVLNIGLNKLGGEFDEMKLGMLLSEIEHLGDGLEVTGFESFEIDALITSIEVDSDSVIDGLDSFLDDDDEDDEDYDDEDDDDGVSVPDGMVKYQFACTIPERELIVEAVKNAKTRFNVNTTNEAMSYIADFFNKQFRKGEV